MNSEEELQELVDALQYEVDTLRRELDEVREQLENATKVVATPVGEASVRALASTVRQCQRNGHPDFGAHLENLLRSLGA